MAVESDKNVALRLIYKGKGYNFRKYVVTRGILLSHRYSIILTGGMIQYGKKSEFITSKVD